MSTPLRERPDAPLGTLIFRAGLLPAETIESALEEGVKTGKRLGEILTERGLIKEVDLARLLAGQRGLEYVTLREQIVDPAAAALFTEEQARLFRALPYTFEDGIPVVAIADPTDDVLTRNIREALGREDVRFVVSTRGELGEIAEDVYSKQLPAPLPTLEVEPEAPSAEAAAPAPEPVAAVEPAAAPADGLEHSGNGVGEPSLEISPAPEPAVPEEPVLPAPASLPAEPAAADVPVDPVPAAPEPVVAPEPVASEPVPDPVAAVEPPVVPDAVEPAPQPLEAPAEPVEPLAEAVLQTPEEPVSFPAEESAPEPVAEPLPAAEAPVMPEPAAPVEPVAGPEPATLEPVPSPEPAPPAPMPYPPAAAQPEAPLEPVEDPVPGGVVFHVTVRLSNGERVEAGEFADLAGAKQQAKSLVTTVAEADQDDWPYVSGRFLKPDTIVSVDIVEQSGDQPAE
jgi:hypothetical protein